MILVLNVQITAFALIVCCYSQSQQLVLTRPRTSNPFCVGDAESHVWFSTIFQGYLPDDTRSLGRSGGCVPVQSL
jgi:hypothetical protein